MHAIRVIFDETKYKCAQSFPDYHTIVLTTYSNIIAFFCPICNYFSCYLEILFD